MVLDLFQDAIDNHLLGGLGVAVLPTPSESQPSKLRLLFVIVFEVATEVVVVHESIARWRPLPKTNLILDILCANL